MTRDEQEQTALMGGSAFQETGMDDYLTRVAEAVRDATLACACAWDVVNNGPLRSAVKLPAVIADVPRPEPVARIIDWPEEPELGHYLAEEPSSAGRSRGLYAEPVAAQPAVPGGWKLAPVEPTDRMLDAMVRALSERGVIDADSIDADYAYRAMLAAAPDAPQPAAPLGTSQNPICLAGEEMARLAEFAGISVDNREDAAGILLWVGEHRDDAGTAGYGLCASLEDYPEEGCYPLVELPRQQPADDAAALRSDIRAMVAMLQAREWAEHVSTSADPDVTDLEVQITELVGTATKLREQNAALVVAMQNIVDEFVPGDEQKLYGTPTDVLDRIRSMARAALACVKGGAV